MDIWKELADEGVDKGLLEEIQAFRASHPVPEEARGAGPRSPLFILRKRDLGGGGRRPPVRAAPAAGRPQGHGQKRAGREPGRRLWPAQLGRVHVRECGRRLPGGGGHPEGRGGGVPGGAPSPSAPGWGASGVLDEVNMAKNEALAVLHATLDFRRVIDVPGYDRILLDDAARFIGTMNYGYAGTRELNEALVSRFVVMDMPVISPENLEKLLLRGFPQMKHTGWSSSPPCLGICGRSATARRSPPRPWTCGGCCPPCT